MFGTSLFFIGDVRIVSDVPMWTAEVALIQAKSWNEIDVFSDRN